MRAPFFVVERDSGDITAFENAEDALGSMEAVDVRDGNYRLFDADGTLLKLVPSTKGQPRRMLGIEIVPSGQVVIDDLSHAEPRPGELQRLLVAAMEQKGISLMQNSLEELVRRAAMSLRQR